MPFCQHVGAFAVANFAEDDVLERECCQTDRLQAWLYTLAIGD